MIGVDSAEEMETLGRALGAALMAGDVVCLVGELGAGKTTLVRGLAAGLAIPDQVSSPTFVLARRHEGPRIALLHCDAYRLSDVDEFMDLALETDTCVTVVEWGADYVPELTDDWLEISIDRGRGCGDDLRSVVLTRHGSRWGNRDSLPEAWREADAGDVSGVDAGDVSERAEAGR